MALLKSRLSGQPAATTDNQFQGLPAHWTLEIDDNLRYRSSVETRDAGTIRFAGRAYRMVSEHGPVAEGTFDLLSADAARISGPLGTATWNAPAALSNVGDHLPGRPLAQHSYDPTSPMGPDAVHHA